MEKPSFSVSDIRNTLTDNTLVRLVGELKVINYNANLGVRNDFYVEPNETIINSLTTSRDLEKKYNQILKGMILADRFPGWIKTGVLLPNFAKRADNLILGHRRFNTSDSVGRVKTTTEIIYDDPDLARQFRQMRIDQTASQIKEMSTDVRVRLFIPGMAEWVQKYETGYYQDGNIKPWFDAGLNNLVWGGDNLSLDSLTPSQIVELAQGGFPFPELTYLEKSEFEPDTENLVVTESIIGTVLSARLHRRAAQDKHLGLVEVRY
jgi:hypothetical protein